MLFNILIYFKSQPLVLCAPSRRGYACRACRKFPPARKRQKNSRHCTRSPKLVFKLRFDILWSSSVSQRVPQIYATLRERLPARRLNWSANATLNRALHLRFAVLCLGLRPQQCIVWHVWYAHIKSVCLVRPYTFARNVLNGVLHGYDYGISCS